jgi:hypothetical protein
LNGDTEISPSLNRYLSEPATIVVVVHTDATSNDREISLRTAVDQVEQKIGVISEGTLDGNGMMSELELLEKGGKED